MNYSGQNRVEENRCSPDTVAGGHSRTLSASEIAEPEMPAPEMTVNAIEADRFSQRSPLSPQWRRHRVRGCQLTG